MINGPQDDTAQNAPVAWPDQGTQTAFDDGVTETTSKSWFQRLREALSGILSGFVLLLGCIILLFWNEGRAVKTANALTEGAGQVVEASAQTLDRSLEGKLVHVSGPLKVTTPPRDADLDVSAAALRLERKVEMYQWRENKSSRTEKKLGGGEETVTSYSYERVWSDTEHRSDSFRQPQGHGNPPFPLKSKSFAAAASLGPYELAAERTGGLGKSAPLALDGRQVAMIGARLRQAASMANGGAYVGQDPAVPQVGDLRITYTAATPEQASIVAAQKGATLTAFTASNGRSIFLARDGIVAAQDMFESAQKGNEMVTWLLRVVGLVLAIAGFGLILRIASVIADVVPIFGSIVGAGTGLIAALLGTCLATLVAGIAWIYYRPMIGLGLLAIALLAITLAWKKTRSAAPQGQRAAA